MSSNVDPWPVIEALTGQLRDLADGDDQLGRGDYAVHKVNPAGQDRFIIEVEDKAGNRFNLRVKVTLDG